MASSTRRRWVLPPGNSTSPVAFLVRGAAPERETSPRARAVAEGHAADAAANAHAVDADHAPLNESVNPAKVRRGKVAKAHTTKKISGLDAAAQVLKDAGEPMRCGDMVQKMLDTGLWKTDGKTPAATIYAAIIREIFPDRLEAKAIALAKRESKLNAATYNWCCVGLFQINWWAHKPWLKQMGVTKASQLLDARVNARAALQMYRRSGGWSPWDL